MHWELKLIEENLSPVALFISFSKEKKKELNE